MDHYQATELTAVEKYLLDELTPGERDDFEEHFFDCQECAIDLRSTAAFMAAAKKEFQANPVAKPRGAANGKSFFASLWPSALVWSALAASLLVVAYQKRSFFRAQQQKARLKAPEILPSISLVGGNSRGGQIPAAEVGAARPFLLQLDIPTQDRFFSYTCLLYSPSGTLAWRVELSPSQRRIRFPCAFLQPTGVGEYTLTVQGNTGQGGTPVNLAHYHFALKGHE